MHLRPALAEPSRETGIPRIGVVSTEVTPGAGGTVANNLAALGAHVSVLGMVGDDGFGYELRHALAARGIATDLLVPAPGVPTFTYTKLINRRTGEEDLPRVDFVYTQPLPAALDAELARRFESAAPRFDVILVSDQAETDQGGVVTPAMRDAVERVAAAHPGILIWVDSRMRAEHFRRVIVKPNQQEAEAASRRALRASGLPRVAPRDGRSAPGRDARRRRRLAGRRIGRALGGYHQSGASGGYLRRGRQLLGRCGVGLESDRRPGDRRAFRQPCRLHHHHEERHRHRLAGRIAVAPP